MAVTDGRRDSGFDTEVFENAVNKRGVRTVLIVLICAVIVVLGWFFYKTLRDQDAKLDELIAQKQELEDRLDELSREKERLESKLEYTNSLEGLLQYARENLGYVFPDDTRYEDQGN